MKAHTVVGRENEGTHRSGEGKGPLFDSGSELLLGRSTRVVLG